MRTFFIHVAHVAILYRALAASTCSEEIVQRLPKIWESSGPPISYGDTATCHGVLKRVSIRCDTVNDIVTQFLFTKMDKDVISDELVNLLKERFVSEFQACVPFACAIPQGDAADASDAGDELFRLPFALLLLLYGNGLLTGTLLRDAALELHELVNVDEFAGKCISTTSDIPKVQLNSGFSMPVIAFGAAGSAKSSRSLREAMDVGFRAIDTATSPLNGDGFDYAQTAVGEALSETRVDRSEIFLTSKVHPGELGYGQTLSAVERALSELGEAAEGYIDLFLIHFPTCDRDYCPAGGALRPLGTFEDSWRALEESVRRRWVCSIGVTNFDAQQLQRLVNMAEIPPAVVGLWADIFHPVPRSLRRICEQHAIQIQVFGVLGYEWSQGRGFSGKLAQNLSPLLTHPVIRNIAKEKGWQSMDVAVKYFLQQGISVILRSTKQQRMLEAYNTAVLPSLSRDEMEQLFDLDGFLSSNLRVHASPDFYYGMTGFDTSHLQAVALEELELGPQECSKARTEFQDLGVTRMRKAVPEAVWKSAQRAAEKVVRDHGGGNWESKDFFPEALCNVMEITIDKFHLTEVLYFFPMLANLKRLARCVLGIEDPGVFYMHLRSKAPGCNASTIVWHQDIRYLLSLATDKRTYNDAHPELTEFAERAAVFHIPLTTETYRKGALMYALGTHHKGLDPNFWAKGWLFGHDPPEYEYDENHATVKLMEAEPGDVLSHSVLVHHGPRPNDTPEVRWHLEVGVQDLQYENKISTHRMMLPDDLSLASLGRYIQEFNGFVKAFLEFVA